VIGESKILETSRPGPGGDWEKFNEIKSPNWIFLCKAKFSPVICILFGVWGTLRSGGRVSGVIIVLRSFPELVWRSV